MAETEPQGRQPMQCADTDRLHAEFGKHFVSLLAWDEPTTGDSDLRDPMALSGFIASVKGLWFWVSAGHLLRAIDERLDGGRRRITRTMFFDRWAGGPFTRGIPIDFAEIRRFAESCERLDYFVLPLRQNTVDLLQANGVSPLDEPRWLELPDPNEIEYCFLEGTPYEKARGLPNRGVTLARASLPARLLSVAPNDAASTLAVSIDAELSETIGPEQIANIKGMSGGPLFAVAHDRQRYWVLGIQSGWHETQRVIHATPLCIVLAAADIAIRVLIEEHRGSAEQVLR